MTLFLSDQIEEAIASMDATAQPSRAQLIEALEIQRGLLRRLKEFASAVEQAHRDRPHVVPMWATAAAGARLYKALSEGDLPPGAALPATIVVSIERYRGRRA